MTTSAKLVKEIIDLPEPPLVYAVCTGAGAGLQKMLWDVPGCSKILVGCSFPYSMEDTAHFLGYEPESSCSSKTAIQLAMEAYKRAWSPGRNAIGLGLTAVVSTNRAHKGDHRVHICTISDSGTNAYSFKLAKQPWEPDLAEALRKVEGQTCDQLALDALRLELNMSESLVKNDRIVESYATVPLPTGIHGFFFERATLLAKDLPEDMIHFPGAFNPPHDGHLAIADAVERSTGKKVVFSIEAEPPHKPALSVPEMLQREKMLASRDVIFTRNEPLYIDKADGGARNFIIGADALLRMLTWKGSTPEKELAPLNKLGVRFYVVDRVVEDRGFVTLGKLLKDGTIPDKFKWMFSTIIGRWDISSTEIRNGNNT